MIKAHREPNLNPKLEAFAFQVAAVAKVKDLEYAGIFHEQGLGKTKIGLDIVLDWLQKSVVDSALIVTKKSLIANWADEIKAHTHITPKILGQDRNANYYALNSPARLYLTHYEVISAEEKRLQLFLKTRKVGIVLDEAQKIKTPDAALTESFHRLSKAFVRRLIMTGTPVANRPYDIWSQIFFLDHGVSLGEDFVKFKASLDLSNDLFKDKNRQIEFESALASVSSKIATFTVRETKKSSGIDLPEKITSNLYCEMEERQSEYYTQYRDELKATVMQAGVLMLDEADDILKRLLRLVQVASNPMLVDGLYKREPGKFPYLERLIDDAVDNGEKTIVWTSFVANSVWLQKLLSHRGAVVINGSVSIDDRNRRISAFKSDDNVKVLIATPGAAKEGLTLTVANNAIFYDRSFSLDDYLQAQDRIHRISQKKACVVTNLIAEGTVDEWVDSLLNAKSYSAQLLQGDIDLKTFDGKMSYDFGNLIKQVLNIEDGATC